MYDPNNDIPSEDNKKTLVIDADTILITAALAVQESIILVKHKETGWEQEFKNITTFHGRKKSKDGGWIGEMNKREGKDPISVEDFTIEKVTRITEEDYVAFGRFNQMIESMTNLPFCGDYKILIGGKGNFRDNIAKITEYKAGRPPKPLRYNEVRQWMINKYKDHVVIEDGIEADDVLAIYGNKGIQEAKKTGVNPYVLCFIDKDAYQCEGWCLNYHAEELIAKYNDQLSAAQHLYAQMLAGDVVDCIKGIPNLTPEIREKYGLKKGRGVTMDTALPFMKQFDNIKDIVSVVHEAYLSYYGEEEFEFTPWKGGIEARTYIDMMQENYQLLRMLPKKGFECNIMKVMDTLNIPYKKG